MDWLLRATDWLHAHTERWHDTWEIAGAIATTAAVFIALASIRREHEATKKAEQREAEAVAERDAERTTHGAERAHAAERERRAQALLVIAYPWMEGIDPTSTARQVGHWQMVVDNYSPAPVFDVRCECFIGDELDSFSERLVLPPGGKQLVFTTSKSPDDDPRTLVYFRDVAGVRWRRDEDGTLTEVDASRQPI